jgi:hypothetical protein
MTVLDGECAESIEAGERRSQARLFPDVMPLGADRVHARKPQAANDLASTAIARRNARLYHDSDTHGTAPLD